jgi:hypothetical protein
MADQDARTVTALENQPNAATENKLLEAQRVALAQPLNPQDQGYRPGIGTRIARGLAAARKGGIAGAIDPTAVGATAYGAPNRQFDIDTARRQAQATVLQSEEDRNIANEKAESERIKDVGTAAGRVGTAYGGVARDATAQQSAEQKSQYEGQIADLRQQLANQGGVPKTYEQAVIASQIDPDPQKRQGYAAAAKQIASQEVKRFQYANRAVGGGEDDPRRQPLIDAATAQVDKLNTYEWDPEAQNGAGGFYDPHSDGTKTYSPAEFTAMKNAIATKLDAQLTQKKMRPLGVRFTVAATTPGGAPAAAQPGAPAAPAQTAPSATTVTQGQVYKGYKYLGGDRANPKSWQQVQQ